PPPRSTLFPYTTLFRSDPGTDRTDLLYEVVMAGTVEHDRGHVVDGAAVGLGDGLNVRPDGLEEIDAAAGDRPDRHLAHVHVGQRDRKSTRLNSSHRTIS